MRLNITITGDDETIDTMRGLPDRVQRAVAEAVVMWTAKLQQHIVADKLSGQVLNVRTGALRRSIQMRVDTSRGFPTGYVYSSGDVKYAAIHEFGGQTAPHEIRPTKAQALAFAMGGSMVFAKVVHHPGSKIPERSYMRSGLSDMADDISKGIKKAAIDAAKSGGS